MANDLVAVDAPRWTDPRRLSFLIVGFTSLFVFFVMSGSIGEFTAKNTFPWFNASFQTPQIFTANTPTGGDMGAHVYLPAYLRDVLLPSGRIMGWSNDWYAGFPILYFYFPLPNLVIVLLDVLLPYGVAFKLVTAAGIVALPAAAYFLVRCVGFGRLIAAVAATAGSVFLFMESFSIFGANIKSTLAGEFSFSWSFALSLVYLGIVIRDTRAGRGFTPLAAIVLALTALAHVVPTMIVVLASLPLLLRPGGPRRLVTSWGLGFALAAVWALPLLVRVFQGMTTDMGWQPVGRIVGRVDAPFVRELWPFLILGIIGIVWTLWRRDDVEPLVWMTLLPLAGYFLIAHVEFTPLYNARLLPYWFFGLHLFTGIAIGLAIARIARWVPEHRSFAAGATLTAATVLILVIAVGLNHVPGWVRWNYSGYEGKGERWAEYEGLMAAVDDLPPGRIMWEANNQMNDYGTPMALMLLPYWSEGHPSMEGLYFESALTTPFHFLNAAEVSQRPSNPVRFIDPETGDLVQRYSTMDFDRALPHLALYNVRYYIAYTDEGRRRARTAELTELASAPPWTIFELPESSLIDIAEYEPAVYRGTDGFREATFDWYDNVTQLNHWMVEEGLPSWPEVADVSAVPLAGRYIPTAGEVSDIVLEDHRIAFRTTAVGVPHLIKVSYFPNWQAYGADGPFRAAPSLMVVVPTREDVEIVFNDTWAEVIGKALNLGGLAVIGVYVWWRRRRSPALAAEETPDTPQAA